MAKFRYQKTDYRIAYLVDEEEKIIPILLAGSHEKFYEELKRIVNN